MKLVGAALGSDIHRAARGVASGSVRVKLIDADGIHSIHEGTEGDEAAAIAHVGYAIEQILVRGGKTSAQGEVVYGRVIEWRTRRRSMFHLGNSAISIAREAERAAPVAGQVADFLFGDHLAGGGGRDINQRSTRRDGHCLGRGANTKRDILRDGLLGQQL